MLEHPTLLGYTSRFASDSTDIAFDLDLVWGQNTFDGPNQLWRATSDYSHKVGINNKHECFLVDVSLLSMYTLF